MTDLTGKIVWINGVGTPLGEALAKLISEQCSSLILSGNDHNRVECISPHLGQDVLLFSTSESGNEHVKTWLIEHAWSWRGQVDVVIDIITENLTCSHIEHDVTFTNALLQERLISPIAFYSRILQRMRVSGAGHIVSVDGYGRCSCRKNSTVHATIESAMTTFVEFTRLSPPLRATRMTPRLDTAWQKLVQTQQELVLRNDLLSVQIASGLFERAARSIIKAIQHNRQIASYGAVLSDDRTEARGWHDVA